MQLFARLFEQDRIGCTALQFDADPRRRTYLLADAYCTSPECSGCSILVRLAPQDAPVPEETLRFWIDPRTGEITAEELDEVGQSIALELWETPFSRHLLLRRRQMVRGLALQERKPARKPFEERLYGLLDFTPDDEQFPMMFAHEGQQWVAIDSCCVRPSCDCDRVVLEFFHIDSPAMVVAVGLDLDSGRAVREPDGRPLRESDQRLLDALLGELEAGRRELGIRRRLIRQLALRHLRLPAEEPRKPTPSPRAERRLQHKRTGPNDPCPCGSGRKYKKCCRGG